MLLLKRKRFYILIVAIASMLLGLTLYLAIFWVDQGSVGSWQETPLQNDQLPVFTSLRADGDIYYWHRVASRPIQKYLTVVSPESFHSWLNTHPDYRVEA